MARYLQVHKIVTNNIIFKKWIIVLTWIKVAIDTKIN